jgi:CRISPR/Cas system CSM-associated protein Csm4 (group 5 of RAMP superfamily)
MNDELENEIKKQQRNLRSRLYYDKNAERIRKQTLEYYYKRKLESGTQDKKRGRKPKPREVTLENIRVTLDGCIKVS